MTLSLRWLLTVAVLLLHASSGAAQNPASAAATASVTFSMYCYWTGEATLGRVEGVLASRIGHWGGSEIVQVDYDSEVTNVAELLRALQEQRSFYSVIAADAGEREHLTSDVEPRDIQLAGGRPRFIQPKHSLRTRHPELWHLGLTEAQAIALNSWSYFGGDMPDVLTAEQKRRLRGD